MKYVDEFRDGELARAIAARIGEAADPGTRGTRCGRFQGGADETHA